MQEERNSTELVTLNNNDVNIQMPATHPPPTRNWYRKWALIGLVVTFSILGFSLLGFSGQIKQYIGGFENVIPNDVDNKTENTEPSQFMKPPSAIQGLDAKSLLERFPFREWPSEDEFQEHNKPIDVRNKNHSIYNVFVGYDVMNQDKEPNKTRESEATQANALSNIQDLPTHFGDSKSSSNHAFGSCILLILMLGVIHMDAERFIMTRILMLRVVNIFHLTSWDRVIKIMEEHGDCKSRRFQKHLNRLIWFPRMFYLFLMRGNCDTTSKVLCESSLFHKNRQEYEFVKLKVEGVSLEP